MKKLIASFIILSSSVLFSQSELNSNGIWVTFNDQSILPFEDQNGDLITGSSELQQLIDDYNITSVVQILPSSRKEELLKVYELRCDCDQDMLIESVLNSEIDLYNPVVAPNYQLLDTPDDYNIAFSSDYALDLIDAEGAWDITHGDSTVELGITDSNYDLNHVELIGGTSYIQSPLTHPNYYHGTAVAVTAAGNTNNGSGKGSIGYDCKLQLYSISYNSLLMATYNGAKVINVSWYSSCSASSYLQQIIDEVYENGSIIVAAAGNGGTCWGAANHVYPASLNHVISVTSVGPNDNHERYIGDPNSTHQHNDSVDIAAPGYDVALTVANGWYLTGNGTSFAAPYVTGTIGLMLSVNPCLTYEDVEYILKETAVNIDSLNPAYAGLLGAGRMDSKKAVEMAKDYQKLDVSINSGFGCTSVEEGYMSVNISSTFGTAPFEINWNTGDNTASVSNVSPGQYYVTVTDSMGCFGFDTVLIEIPEFLNVEGLTNNVICNGDNTGSIDVLVSGGTPNYQYSWSTGETTQNIMNLNAGTYNLIVTDENDCEVMMSYQIEEADQIEVIASIENSSCFGSNDGAIDIQLPGPVSDFSIIWSTGSNNEDVIDLSPGNYELSITNSLGCQMVKKYHITQPDELELYFDSNVFLNQGELGSIDLTVEGGTLDYSYLWNDGSTNEDLIDAEPGIYSVIVTDANGCVKKGTTNVSNISSTSQVSQNTGDEITLYPNPSNGTSILKWENNTVESLVIFDSNGRIVSEIIPEGSYELLLDFLSSGVYYININYANSTVTKKLVVL